MFNLIKLKKHTKIEMTKAKVLLKLLERKKKKIRQS